MNPNARGGLRGVEERAAQELKDKKKKAADDALLASLFKNM
jgi:hypothetical protein